MDTEVECMAPSVCSRVSYLNTSLVALLVRRASKVYIPHMPVQLSFWGGGLDALNRLRGLFNLTSPELKNIGGGLAYFSNYPRLQAFSSLTRGNMSMGPYF